MDEKISCDICGDIGIVKNHKSMLLVDESISGVLRQWLFCNECARVVYNFVDCLQADRPKHFDKDWPIPEDIEQAGKSAAILRQQFLKKSDIAEIVITVNKHGLR